MNRTELHSERRSTIETDFNIINDKLDLIIDSLNRLSEELLYIAKTDDYKKIFDEQMGSPVQMLEDIFNEVKK